MQPLHAEYQIPNTKYKIPNTKYPLWGICLCLRPAPAPAHDHALSQLSESCRQIEGEPFFSRLIECAGECAGVCVRVCVCVCCCLACDKRKLCKAITTASPALVGLPAEALQMVLPSVWARERPCCPSLSPAMSCLVRPRAG